MNSNLKTNDKRLFQPPNTDFSAVNLIITAVVTVGPLLSLSQAYELSDEKQRGRSISL